jgi:hypothetical protein
MDAAHPRQMARSHEPIGLLTEEPWSQKYTAQRRFRAAPDLANPCELLSIDLDPTIHTTKT